MDGSGEITEFRAAQYVRMSTEHQQYSTLNQSDKIREYAEKRGIEIIKTYADDGKSGLSIGGRAALQQLIAEVFAGQCRLIELGFRQGGPAGFGLRRVLVDERGEIKGELKRGINRCKPTVSS